jgi:HK97 family phage major capsid protein
MTMQELLQQREGLIVKQETILNTIKTEKRNMSVDEKSMWDKINIDISETEQTMERMKNFEEKVKNRELNNYKEVDFSQKETTENNKEFATIGEFLVAVAKAGTPVGRFKGAGAFDERLINAASGHSATVPSEGGFLITPTRSNEILRRMYENGSILGACSVYDIGDYSDTLEIPYVDETSRANGSRWGGLRAYREGEADTPTPSKTKLGLWECRVTDLKAISYVTERLLNDAPALESLIMQQLDQEFSYKVEDEILNGEGGAQCKGIIGDPATVSVAKETGQVAATILYDNVVKMWSRCWGASRAKAAWYHNQDIEPQLMALTFNAGTSGVPMFMPPNGLSGSPYATLLGKPLKPVEQAATLGTVGDLIFGDFSQYAIVRKGGLNSQSSIHVRFIYDEMTFKFSMRVNGKSKWKSALTPFKGTNTLSPFVTLATR